MHWTEAVNKNAHRMAVRQDSEGRLIFRRADGSGEIETYYSRDHKLSIPEFREAFSSELEGFDDWSPAVGFLNLAFLGDQSS